MWFSRIQYKNDYVLCVPVFVCVVQDVLVWLKRLFRNSDLVELVYVMNVRCIEDLIIRASVMIANIGSLSWEIENAFKIVALSSAVSAKWEWSPLAPRCCLILLKRAGFRGCFWD